MSKTHTEPESIPRVVVDKPTRQPLDHPGRLPEEVELHPTVRFFTETRRLRVRVVRRSRPQ